MLPLHDGKSLKTIGQQSAEFLRPARQSGKISFAVVDPHLGGVINHLGCPCQCLFRKDSVRYTPGIEKLCTKILDGNQVSEIVETGYIFVGLIFLMDSVL